MKFLYVLCALCGLVLPTSALDREAFTFTKYDLDVRVEPEQQRLAVRGRITLRNDTGVSQKSLALQISSTLSWRAITSGGEPLQFETHQYTSDIDHTGALSEAIVTLPHEVPSKGTLEFDIGYEGVIPLDTTRLTRIGVPQDKAKNSDWDQISKSFTAVRGIGYVAWYPVATEAASLSEGDSIAEAVGRWKVRHATTAMRVSFQSTSQQPVFFSGIADSAENSQSYVTVQPAICVPTFASADYQKLPTNNFLDLHFLAGQQEAATTYAEVASHIDPIIPVVRSTAAQIPGLQVLGLPDENDSAFVTQGMLLTPFKTPLTNEAELDMVYALALRRIVSPRAWIQEGLAHYAQAAFIEEQKGRQSALDYLDAHKEILVEAEKHAGERTGGGSATDSSVIKAPDNLYLQTKSMYVWWMLRDMSGDASAEVLRSYQYNLDKDAPYVQTLLEKQYHRDLQWFFDDWVYHDRGLPDFRVASVFSTPVNAGGSLVTIEIENLGNAGAEVPITLQTESGEVRGRLEVHARSKSSVRIEAQSAPKEVIINDGSVPESDVSNNTFKIESLSH